jgi:hypothetical protein
MIDGDAHQTGLADLEARLEAAQRDTALLDGHLARRDRAQSAVREVSGEVSAARARLADEAADVARLESWSLTRVWAGVRGDREEKLVVERGEQQAAEYAVAVAEAREKATRDELRVVEDAVASLGDVAGRRAQALADLEGWFRTAGGSVATELTGLADAVGRRRAELVEIAQAREAADAAGSALAAAAHELSGADGWSTYDTFFGGDMLSSMVKHDKLDRAAEQIRHADRALAHLTVELGDLGERGIGEVGVSGTSRTFDIWFDNIFTDLSVAQHIRESSDRVDRALAAVRQVAAGLDERRGFAEQDLRVLAARRESILVASVVG